MTAIFSFTCSNLACHFRTTSHQEPQNLECPFCKSELRIQRYSPDLADTEKKHVNFVPPHLEVILDNIRSALNVGSILRTSDGCGVKKIHVCGVTSKPDNSKIAKTGLGAQWTTSWVYYRNVVDCLSTFNSTEYLVLALEQTNRSINLFEFDRKPYHQKKTVLIIGNELTGCDPEVLKLSQLHISIPMSGYKRSLNVAVAYGIAAYYLQFSSHGEIIQS